MRGAVDDDGIGGGVLPVEHETFGHEVGVYHPQHTARYRHHDRAPGRRGSQPYRPAARAVTDGSKRFGVAAGPDGYRVSWLRQLHRRLDASERRRGGARTGPAGGHEPLGGPGLGHGTDACDQDDHATDEPCSREHSGASTKRLMKHGELHEK